MAAASARMVKYLAVDHKAATIAAATMINTPVTITVGLIPITVSDNSINVGVKIVVTSTWYDNRLVIGMMVIVNCNPHVNHLTY